MRKQQQIWHEEHASQGTLPSMADIEPSSSVVMFTDYLARLNVPLLGKTVDIGAGKGRNSIHLAKLGLEVYALDYIQPALDIAKQSALQADVEGNVHFYCTEIDRAWDFADEYFDFAIDSFSSIDIETLSGRKTCRDEMYRTLKPGGYAMVSVCSADDEWERELIAKYPGPEPNSTIWPQNDKFQKDYDESELQQFYEKFKIIELQKVSKPAHKLGRDGTATNFWLVLQKP